MPAKGQVGKTGPRPHTWCTGPDPVRHEKHIAWARARAQAHFRGEAWLLTFEDWETAWGEEWHRRGRHRDCLLLTRLDPDQPWQLSNVSRLTRAEFDVMRYNQQRLWYQRRAGDHS